MLTSDLDGEDEKDRACLENALGLIIGELNMAEPDFDVFFHRTPQREVHLVIMRLLSKFTMFLRRKPFLKMSANLFIPSSPFVSYLFVLELRWKEGSIKANV